MNEEHAVLVSPVTVNICNRGNVPDYRCRDYNETGTYMTQQPLCPLSGCCVWQELSFPTKNLQAQSSSRSSSCDPSLHGREPKHWLCRRRRCTTPDQRSASALEPTQSLCVMKSPSCTSLKREDDPNHDSSLHTCSIECNRSQQSSCLRHVIPGCRGVGFCFQGVPLVVGAFDF